MTITQSFEKEIEEDDDAKFLLSQSNDATKTKLKDLNEEDDSEEGSLDDGEGSLEDAIANLSIGISPHASSSPSAASTSTSTSSIFENLKEKKSEKESTGDNVSDHVVTVDSLGFGLPINVREALRYRIRKKMWVAFLLWFSTVETTPLIR